MASGTQTAATLDDLLRVEGKAELIAGRIVHQMPVGHRPNRVAGRIFRSLADHADQIGRGYAYTDSMGFAVPPLMSGRQSFSPDASFYDGPLPANPMRFIEGPPTFAVEVRSEGDYGPAADVEMARKRADYFEAGTQVVWDVDPVAETIAVYSSDEVNTPEVYRVGQEVGAEPVVRDWRVAVAWIFG